MGVSSLLQGSGSDLSGNASPLGGALYAGEGSFLAILAGSIRRNTANNGAGLYIDTTGGSATSLQLGGDVIVSSNTASAKGGPVCRP